jgi:formylmethanofuran dehydrogenase subunit B
MYQRKRYEIIRNMDYNDLRNYLRPKKNIDIYAQLFKDLENSCLFIKDALKIYENIPQVKNDEKLFSAIKNLNSDTKYILIYIQTISKFFTHY